MYSIGGACQDNDQSINFTVAKFCWQKNARMSKKCQ